MGGLTFKPELAEAVMAGRKTVTRRRLSDNPNSPWWRESCRFILDRDYAVQPGRGRTQIGRAFITFVSKQRLGAMSEGDAQAEGFEDLSGFYATWSSLYGSVDLDQSVWAVGLERMLRYRAYVRLGTRWRRTLPTDDLAAGERFLRRFGCGGGVIVDNQSGEQLSYAALNGRKSSG
jgi:hypothetical protein